MMTMIIKLLLFDWFVQLVINQYCYQASSHCQTCFFLCNSPSPQTIEMHNIEPECVLDTESENYYLQIYKDNSHVYKQDISITYVQDQKDIVCDKFSYITIQSQSIEHGGSVTIHSNTTVKFSALHFQFQNISRLVIRNLELNRLDQYSYVWLDSIQQTQLDNISIRNSQIMSLINAFNVFNFYIDNFQVFEQTTITKDLIQMLNSKYVEIQDLKIIDSYIKQTFLKTRNSQILVSRSNIDSNRIEGSVFDINQSSYLNLKNNITFDSNTISNYQDRKGALVTADNSYLNITDTYLRQNIVMDSMAIVYCQQSFISLNRVVARLNGFNQSGHIVKSQCQLEMVDSRFEDNVALGEIKGGCCVFQQKNSMMIKGSTFVNNYDSSRGGSIYQLGGDVQISDSTFKENKSDQGGALIFLEITNLNIKNCYFYGNSAKLEGGAILLRTSYISHASIINSTFSLNVNAILINKSPRLMVQIKGCKFLYNLVQQLIQEAISDINHNGNQDRGAAIYIHSALVFQLHSCTFRGNLALKATSLYYILPQLSVNNFQLFTDEYDRQISIKNNTFQNNGADFISAGLYFTLSKAQENDFFWFNQQFQKLNYTDPSFRYIEILDNRFVGNQANFPGSCIRINGQHRQYFNTVQLQTAIYKNNIFINNTQQFADKYQFNMMHKYQKEVLIECSFGEYRYQDINQFEYCHEVSRGSRSNRNNDALTSSCNYGFVCLGSYNDIYLKESYYYKFNTSVQQKGFGVQQSAFKCAVENVQKFGFQGYSDISTNYCVNQSQCAFIEYCQQTDQEFKVIDTNDTEIMKQTEINQTIYQKTHQYLFCCTANTTNCLKGYSGPLCTACDKNMDQKGGAYYKQLNICVQCDQDSAVYFSIIKTMLKDLFILVIFMYSIQSKISKIIQCCILNKYMNIYCRNTDMSSSLMRITVSYFQTVYLVIQYKTNSRAQYDDISKQIYQFIALQVDSKITSTSSMCLFQSYFKVNDQIYDLVFLDIKIIVVLLIFSLLQIVYIFCVNRYRLKKIDKSVHSRSICNRQWINNQSDNYQLVDNKKSSIYLQSIVNRLFLVFTLVFMYYQNQFINSTLDYFLCEQIGDQSQSMADFNQKCGQTGNMFLPYFNITLYFAIIIAYFLAMVVYYDRNRNIYHNQSKIQSLLIYFHIGYNERGYYFEFIRLIKRFLLVLFLKLDFADGYQNFQIFLIVQMVYLQQLNSVKPYNLPFCQKMEQWAVYGEILTFIFMLTYNSENEQTMQSIINVITMVLNCSMNGIIFIYLAIKISQSFTEKYKYKYLARFMKHRNEIHRKVIRMWRKLSFHSWKLVKKTDLALSYGFSNR